MKEYVFDSVVIGGGSAGMASAVEIAKNGFSVAVIEREDTLGGVLLQCIHNGFGLHEFKEELTGPEYAERWAEISAQTDKLQTYLETTVMEVTADDDFKTIYCYSSKYGVFSITTRSVVLAMGCRERNRGNIGVPGSRPTGVFTAGLAQRLVNMDGYIPGKNVVIVGSGDIGLIMARRMTWAGCKVHAVIEIQPYPAGLTRNIVQCLNDFDIPLYLSHSVTKIYGNERVEKIDVTPIDEGKLDFSKTFSIDCDTLLLSVGLVPENELSKKFGVELNPQNNGPFVKSNMMTNVEGVFACGNVLHVHDLVDFVTEESRRTGAFVADYLRGNTPKREHKAKAGANVRYVVPQKFNPDTDNKFFFRPMIVKNKAEIQIRLNNNIIKTIKKNHIQPSEMESIILKKEDLAEADKLIDPSIEISAV